MKKTLKNALVIAALTPAIALANVNSISLLSNPKDKNLPTEVIINIVKNNINSPSANKAKVQVVYNNQNKPDYLLAFLLPEKSYSVTITKIKIDGNLKVVSVSPNYHLTKEDLKQQASARLNKRNFTCPDSSINFVVGTAYDDFPTAVEAVNKAYDQANSSGYTAKKLLGVEASVENYLNLLSCPNLKGFYSIGGGSEEGILVSDGFVTFENINDELKGKLTNTVVVFNTGHVWRDPMKKSIVIEANAQKYVAGISDMWVGPSEQATLCFWDAAFKGQSMSNALISCNETHDSQDEIEIKGLGSDLLNKP